MRRQLIFFPKKRFLILLALILSGYLRDMIVVVSAGHKLASFQFLILSNFASATRNPKRIELGDLFGSLKALVGFRTSCGQFLTNDERVRRGLADNPSCSLCGALTETFIDILRGCSIAKAVWINLIPHDAHSFFVFNQDLRPCLVSNIGCSANCRSNIPLWSSIFGIVFWKLWKSRNGFIFNSANCSAYNVILTSLAWGRCYGSHTRSHGCKSGLRVNHQTLPNPGWIKVNCDGPLQSMVKKAAGGGLLRDENGTWILGYGRCLGERSVVQAEAWAMYNGLRIAWEHGYKKVQVETVKESKNYLVNRN